MKKISLVICCGLLLVAMKGNDRPPEKGSDRREQQQTQKPNTQYPNMNSDKIPYLDDIDFDEQIIRIEESDKAAMQSLQAAIEGLSPSNKLAAAILALHSYDKTPSNPLKIQTHDDDLGAAIELIEKLSPIGKLEFAKYLLDEEDDLLSIGIETAKEAEATEQINPEYNPIPF